VPKPSHEKRIGGDPLARGCSSSSAVQHEHGCRMASAQPGSSFLVAHGSQQLQTSLSSTGDSELCGRPACQWRPLCSPPC
jgi:hypothetical protein